MEVKQDKEEKIMGSGESKEIPGASPLGCILTDWNEITGVGSTESKHMFVKYCTQ